MATPARIVAGDRQASRLPAPARQLLAQGQVDFKQAYEFLGLQHSAAYKLAARYLKRVTKATSRPVFDARVIQPRRNARGEWTEIPVYKIGAKYMCRADLIVAMVYPEEAGRP